MVKTRRTAGERCALLLAGYRPRGVSHGRAWAACCRGSRDYHHQRGRRAANRSRFHRRGGSGRTKCLRTGSEKRQFWGFVILRRGKTDPLRGPWKHPALKNRLDLAFEGGRANVTERPENESGNSRLVFEIGILTSLSQQEYHPPVGIQEPLLSANLQPKSELR